MSLKNMRVWMMLALAACATPTAPAPATVTLYPLPRGTPASIATPSPKATPVIIASPTSSATPVTHVVRQGETLISVAVDYGVSLEALQAANPGVSPRFLSVGAVLVIPAPGDAPVVPSGAPTPLPVSFGAPACHALGSGAMYCFVEARNPNALALEAITARITVAGADGLPLADALAQPALDAIPAGGAMTLAAYFENAPGDLAAIGVTAVTAFPLSDMGARYVLIDVTEIRAEPSDPEWEVAAELRNGGPADAATVKLALTLYDAANTIIGYRQQTLATGLAAGVGQTVTIAATPLCCTVARYTLQAQGRP